MIGFILSKRGGTRQSLLRIEGAYVVEPEEGEQPPKTKPFHRVVFKGMYQTIIIALAVATGAGGRH